MKYTMLYRCYLNALAFAVLVGHGQGTLGAAVRLKGEA